MMNGCSSAIGATRNGGNDHHVPVGRPPFGHGVNDGARTALHHPPKPHAPPMPEGLLVVSKNGHGGSGNGKFRASTNGNHHHLNGIPPVVQTTTTTISTATRTAENTNGIPSNRPNREDVLRRLSEALLRRSLTKIDLSQRGLIPSDARLVKMALLQNGQLHTLRLGYNQLGDEGAVLLSAGIARHYALESLDLGFNDIGDEGCRALASAFSSPPPPPPGVVVAGGSNSCGTRRLRTLYLAGNLIGEDGAMALADVLRPRDDGYGGGSLRRGSRLQRLYLTGNRLGPDGARALAEACLEDELRGRGMAAEIDDFRDASFSSSSPPPPPIVEDAMGTDPAGRGGGASCAGGAGCESSSTGSDSSSSSSGGGGSGGMKELFLGGTGMGPEGCRSVARLLGHTARLTVLSLPNCDIGDEAVADLAASIKSNRQRLPLSQLHLSFNSITCRGMECLANAIWGSRTLKKLLLDNNEIGDRGAHQMATVLPFLRTLETLDVGFNSIQSAGVRLLMKAVAVETTSLLSLSVSGNPVDVAAAKSIAYALAYNRSLLSLFLVHCGVTTEGRRHIAAGIVSNRRIALRELTGFRVGPAVVTLGFPAALEHWNNEQILNFIHLMWEQQQQHDEEQQAMSSSTALCEEEKTLDPLHFLGGSDHHSVAAVAAAGGRGTPLEAAVVVEVARKAFATLVEKGVDVFSRRPGHPNQDSFASPIAGDNNIVVECPSSSSCFPPQLASPSSAVPNGSLPGAAAAAMLTEVDMQRPSDMSSHSPEAMPTPTRQARSFVAPPEPKAPQKKPSLPDPARKKRIVEWLCANIAHLNRLGQQPFSSAELWKLHQHYFTPVVNESGGSVAPSPNPSAGSVAGGFTVWSVPEVSRGVGGKGGDNYDMGGLCRSGGGIGGVGGCGVGGPSEVGRSGGDNFVVPSSDPSMMPGSAPDSMVSSLPMLKRKVSYRFLGDAAGQSKAVTTGMSSGRGGIGTHHGAGAAASGQANGRRHHNGTAATGLPFVARHQQPSSQQQSASVSMMIQGGPAGQASLPLPKTKRARRNRTRISFLPRVKAKLDSYLDVCHEKALATMRQLFYVEQAILAGRVNPVDPATTSRTHLCGDTAADAETIVVDMI